MELTLTKTVNYKLEPYGKFKIRWTQPKNEKINEIYIAEIKIRYETGMSMTNDQENNVVKFMKKNHTDVLTDGSKWYTLTNYGMTEIWHIKLVKYTNDPAFKELIDNL